jgi:ketosteroid isomerase-like protein
MSQENVEMVKRVIEAINRRDIEEYLACCTEDVQFITPVAEVAGAYEGTEGIGRFFADLADVGPDFNLAIERLQAIGEDRVLAFNRMSVTGRTSGIPAGSEAGNVYTELGTIYDFAEGKIKRIRVFLDRDEALEAAGLPE